MDFDSIFFDNTANKYEYYTRLDILGLKSIKQEFITELTKDPTLVIDELDVCQVKNR